MGEIIGRLAKRPYRSGDELPEVGTLTLVSGANCDVESDQHRSYLWRKVIGYANENQFIVLQTRDCWPTVERTEFCWFASDDDLVNSCAGELLSIVRRTYEQLADVQHQWPGRYTGEGQRLLCDLRDVLAKVSARDPKDVQDQYSVRAHGSRA
jgi:hypothetical protein